MTTYTTDYANTAITPFEGRDPHSATIVFVHRNLHSDNWSIRAADGPHKDLVVGHATHLVLEFARWRVNEAGRQRVLREQSKNVHAGVFGILADVEPDPEKVNWQRVSYNPYQADHFYMSEDVPAASHVDSSRWAMFDINGKAWAA